MQITKRGISTIRIQRPDGRAPAKRSSSRSKVPQFSFRASKTDRFARLTGERSNSTRLSYSRRRYPRSSRWALAAFSAVLSGTPLAGCISSPTIPFREYPHATISRLEMEGIERDIYHPFDSERRPVFFRILALAKNARENNNQDDIRFLSL